jgi:hypothetical protein
LVTLEKDLASYFDGRPLWVSKRSVTKEHVLEDVMEAVAHLGFQVADLHKGIKKLWADDFMDCSRAKYKKPHSTAWETMDEGRGIRQYNPDLYQVLKKSTLLNALFQINPASASTVSVVYTSPSEGAVAFPRYSKKQGDADHVLGEIVRHN